MPASCCRARARAPRAVVGASACLGTWVLAGHARVRGFTSGVVDGCVRGRVGASGKPATSAGLWLIGQSETGCKRVCQLRSLIPQPGLKLSVVRCGLPRLVLALGCCCQPWRSVRRATVPPLAIAAPVHWNRNPRLQGCSTMPPVTACSPACRQLKDCCAILPGIFPPQYA